MDQIIQKTILGIFLPFFLMAILIVTIFAMAYDKLLTTREI